MLLGWKLSAAVLKPSSLQEELDPKSQTGGLALWLQGVRGRLTIHRLLIPPHVHEEQIHGGEGGGIDREGPQQGGG